MKKIALSLVFLSVFILGVNVRGYCAAADTASLVDNFYKATDLQRTQFLKDNLGKEISCGGTVNNAGEYDFFDTVNDVGATYYQVTTNPQKTKNNVTYQIVFLFKDKDKEEIVSILAELFESGQLLFD